MQTTTDFTTLPCNQWRFLLPNWKRLYSVIFRMISNYTSLLFYATVRTFTTLTKLAKRKRPFSLKAKCFLSWLILNIGFCRSVEHSEIQFIGLYLKKEVVFIDLSTDSDTSKSRTVTFDYWWKDNETHSNLTQVSTFIYDICW